MEKITPADFDDYVQRFPESTRRALRKMRSTIKSAAPGAAETISYNLPAFCVNGKVLVWFAAFKSHLGFYPGAAAVRAFAPDLRAYKTARGSIQFPLDDALPANLIDRIVNFKLHEIE